jgi:predicted metal-dependent phosphoesterase TrpH
MLIDFHVHARPSSLYPIRQSWVENILKTAIQVGLDAIVIVDHNLLNGPLLARRIQTTKQLPLLVIPGVEITSIWNMRPIHIIALNMKHNILPYRRIETIIEAIRKQDGTIILPHPSLDLLDSFHKDIDGFEVRNGRHPNPHITDFRTNRQFNNLLRTYGSDAHILSEIGNVTSQFDVEDLTRRRILR